MGRPSNREKELETLAREAVEKNAKLAAECERLKKVLSEKVKSYNERMAALMEAYGGCDRGEFRVNVPSANLDMYAQTFDVRREMREPLYTLSVTRWGPSSGEVFMKVYGQNVLYMKLVAEAVKKLFAADSRIAVDLSAKEDINNDESRDFRRV